LLEETPELVHRHLAIRRRQKDEVARSLAEACRHRAGEPAVGLVVDDANIRVLRRKRIGELARAVTAAIVDDQHLAVPVDMLREGAPRIAHRALEVLDLVIGGDRDRHTHRAKSRFGRRVFGHLFGLGPLARACRVEFRSPNPLR